MARDPAAERAEMLAQANAAAREISQRTREAGERGNVLSELEALRELEFEFASRSEMVQDMLAQILATRSAELGNYADAIRYFDQVLDQPAATAKTTAKTSANTTSKAALELEGYVARDALEALAEQATEAQVIMINEAHHVPEHRGFSLRLLELLKHRGFTHFAAETLYESDIHLQERGYPSTQSGSYTVEPVYGDLVRTALRLGYRVVAYESPPNGNPVHDREHGQAKNLVDRILRDSPEAKVFVHAGYSHIHESGLLAGHPPMAAQFGELTGIDPLTIDQTKMTAHSRPKLERPMYRQITKAGQITKPSLFQKGSELWSADPEKYDVTVFHPRPAIRDGRPVWLRLGGQRVDFHLPKRLANSQRHLLIRAMVAGESSDAVPVDQVEIVPGKPLPVLLLPAGDAEILVEDASGASVESFRVRIP